MIFVHFLFVNTQSDVVQRWILFKFSTVSRPISRRRLCFFSNVCVFNVCLRSADGTINAISGSAMSKDPFEPAKLLVTFFESEILSCNILL